MYMYMGLFAILNVHIYDACCNVSTCVHSPSSQEDQLSTATGQNLALRRENEALHVRMRRSRYIHVYTCSTIIQLLGDRGVCQLTYGTYCIVAANMYIGCAVLLCLIVCLTFLLFPSFLPSFLPSHLSLKHVHVQYVMHVTPNTCNLATQHDLS